MRHVFGTPAHDRPPLAVRVIEWGIGAKSHNLQSTIYSFPQSCAFWPAIIQRVSKHTIVSSSWRNVCEKSQPIVDTLDCLLLGLVDKTEWAAEFMNWLIVKYLNEIIFYKKLSRLVLSSSSHKSNLERIVKL